MQTVVLSKRVYSRLSDKRGVLEHCGVSSFEKERSTVLYFTRAGIFSLVVSEFDVTVSEFITGDYNLYKDELKRTYGFHMDMRYTVAWLLTPIIQIAIHNVVPHNMWTKFLLDRIGFPTDVCLRFLSGIPETYIIYNIVVNILNDSKDPYQEALLNHINWNKSVLSPPLTYSFIRTYSSSVPFFASVYSANSQVMMNNIDFKIAEFAEARYKTQALKGTVSDAFTLFKKNVNLLIEGVGGTVETIKEHATWINENIVREDGSYKNLREIRDANSGALYVTYYLLDIIHLGELADIDSDKQYMKMLGSRIDALQASVDEKSMIYGRRVKKGHNLIDTAIQHQDFNSLVIDVDADIAANKMTFDLLVGNIAQNYPSDKPIQEIETLVKEQMISRRLMDRNAEDHLTNDDLLDEIQKTKDMLEVYVNMRDDIFRSDDKMQSMIKSLEVIENKGDINSVLYKYDDKFTKNMQLFRSSHNVIEMKNVPSSVVVALDKETEALTKSLGAALVASITDNKTSIAKNAADLAALMQAVKNAQTDTDVAKKDKASAVVALADAKAKANTSTIPKLTPEQVALEAKLDKAYGKAKFTEFTRDLGKLDAESMGDGGIRAQSIVSRILKILSGEEDERNTIDFKHDVEHEYGSDVNTDNIKAYNQYMKRKYDEFKDLKSAQVDVKLTGDITSSSYLSQDNLKENTMKDYLEARNTLFGGSFADIVDNKNIPFGTLQDALVSHGLMRLVDIYKNIETLAGDKDRNLNLGNEWSDRDDLLDSNMLNNNIVNDIFNKDKIKDLAPKTPQERTNLERMAIAMTYDKDIEELIAGSDKVPHQTSNQYVAALMTISKFRDTLYRSNLGVMCDESKKIIQAFEQNQPTTVKDAVGTVDTTLASKLKEVTALPELIAADVKFQQEINAETAALDAQLDVETQLAKFQSTAVDPNKHAEFVKAQEDLQTILNDPSSRKNADNVKHMITKLKDFGVNDQSIVDMMNRLDESFGVMDYLNEFFIDRTYQPGVTTENIDRRTNGVDVYDTDTILLANLSSYVLYGAAEYSVSTYNFFKNCLPFSRDHIKSAILHPLRFVNDNIPHEAKTYIPSLESFKREYVPLSRSLEIVSKPDSSAPIIYNISWKTNNDDNDQTSWFNPNHKITDGGIRFYYPNKTHLTVNKYELSYILEESFKQYDSIYCPIVDREQMLFDPKVFYFRIPNTVTTVIVVDEFSKVALEHIEEGYDVLVKDERYEYLVHMGTVLRLQGAYNENGANKIPMVQNYIEKVMANPIKVCSIKIGRDVMYN